MQTGNGNVPDLFNRSCDKCFAEIQLPEPGSIYNTQDDLLVVDQKYWRMLSSRVEVCNRAITGATRCAAAEHDEMRHIMP
jgi:hypothetical protein